MPSPFATLRSRFDALQIDAFLCPVQDAFQGEYVPDSERRLAWLCGFSGSAGTLAVLREEAALFTDGRYTLQAADEVDTDAVAVLNVADTELPAWLKSRGERSGTPLRVGFDPWLHTVAQLRRWREHTGDAVVWTALEPNPIDALWTDRPAPSATPVVPHPLEYAGQSSEEKRRDVAQALKGQGVDVFLLTAPDSLAWLLNIRASDVPHTPLALTFGAVHADGGVDWWVDAVRLGGEAAYGEDIHLLPPQTLQACLRRYAARGLRVAYAPRTTAEWFRQVLADAGAEVREIVDPCVLPKAIKNAVECDGMRAAHRRDGLALTRFLYWLDQAVARGEAVSELGAAERLREFRAGQPLFQGLSFDTISGFGAHGAIVHYRVTADSNAVMTPGGLYLVDSGGQYLDGTTDVTRTVAIGRNTPGEEERAYFTAVLRGHIALARARFPKGTTGAQLDALARAPLWELGADFDHGTGHGVGSYLSVHEGPQGISRRAGEVALVPGMVLSNEPGYYKTDAYGIRIESLVLVVEAPEHPGFLCFETLTLAPIDRCLILANMLTPGERVWLNAYHARVYNTHAARLEDAERVWLREETAEI